MIYLDSAATTLQKPPAVSQAVQYAIAHFASPGRGGYRPAMDAANAAFSCRQAAAELFGLSDPERVVFTLNATHALNIAIKTLVKPGDTVLISGYEHNAVTRPLRAIGGVSIKVAAAPPFEPEALYRRFEELLTDEVRCVVCNHISNVFGYLLPMEWIAALCKARGVPLVIDASQSAGTIPISMQALGCAFIAMPGHKGLYGPQGTGLLLCGTDQVTPLLEGGTGSYSTLQTMPDFLPDRLEAGTLNVAGVAGLLEGLRFIKRRGEANILRHERVLVFRAAEGLARLPGVKVYTSAAYQTGVLSFTVKGMDCEEVGEQLGKADIAVRSGLHCAPLAHQTAGTLDTGTVRASFSAFNTQEEADALVWAVGRITKNL